MKNLLLATMLFCFAQLNAQVGIGTNTPDASAQLDIVSTAKGMLVPRVTAAQRASISTPATGLLVYQTDGTSGFYVYKGSAWYPILDNSTGYLPLAGGTLTGALIGTTSNFATSATSPLLIGGTGTTSSLIYKTTKGVGAAGADHIFQVGNNGATEAMRILNNGNIGIGTASPSVRLDARSTSGDAAIAIGQTSQTPATAGAGAVRYSTSSGGILQYSNGTTWNTFSSTVQKSLVTGYLSGVYANNFFGNLTATEVLDVNGDFSGNTFTAPRNGNYTFTIAVSSDVTGANNLNTTWEVQVVPSAGDHFVSRYIVPAAYTGTISANGAYTANLVAGTTVTFKLFQSVGSSKTLAAADYNRFSIVEN